MIDAISVILAALIAIACVAGMAIVAGRAWAASKLTDDPEHLGAGVEFDASFNQPPTE